jgi:hypothetical protein
MAEATKSTRTVTTTEESYTLTLNAAEYRYLYDLIGSQPGADGDGASRSVWGALKAPASGDHFTCKGMAYDLTAAYLDASDDLWRFTGARDSNGEPLISCMVEDSAGYQDWPLSRFVETYSYGPGIRRA